MSTLSEFASKEILARHGLPILQERVVNNSSEVGEVLANMSLPVVAKLCGPSIAHKTERGLVKLNLQTVDDVCNAVDDLLAAAVPADGEVEVLIAPMVKSSREFIAGVVRDAQFGANVMLGVGGVLAEAIADVVFRPVPLSAHDAHEMVSELRSQKLLGEFRGEPAVSVDALVRVLLALSTVSTERSDITSIDLNPLLVTNTGEVVAVDALVEIEDASTPPTNHNVASSVLDDDHFRALFEPKGVVVTGASSHPGKFGFVSVHNILASGYAGAVFGTNLSQEEVLGIQTVASLDDVPKDAADLVFVCTPSSANPEILRACARRGIKAAFLTSAGYGEAGDEGIRLEQELIALANELGILLAGPNGQGVVSTPSQLCAQIVAPYPPRGRIGVASQSGNFVSSFLNYSRQSGVGVSRAVSAGNAACVSVADYLKWYSTDNETSVGLAYLEGIFDGSHLMKQLQDVTRKMPLVIMKGGATEAGAKAAASHTGALAANDKVFDGACRQSGISRAKNVEEAFDTAACFATQPLPKGGRTVILTTAGGWGVVTSDALMSTQELTLVDLPDDLKAAIDEKLPPRWSKSNPVDCAGGETRDTIPEVMGLIARHKDVDAVIYLGIGIQSNQARLMHEGKFYPDHGLERIVAYHERQDARFAEAADELIKETGKPILIASELAIGDPDNAGPRTVRETGRYCFPSGHRAVAALAHMVRYSNYLSVH
ncbi:MAG: acetate--CoA ligase family protein [Actinobacteria bacterium]|nr:acetate--CoA ligase family protein [Actinomycetota bacterium]